MNYVLEDETIYMSSFPEYKPLEKIEKGLYKLHGKLCITPLKAPTLIKFEEEEISGYINKFNDFFNEETKKTYKNLNMIHKTGIIFYGPQGTGKTSLVLLILQEIINNHNAIVLDCKGVYVNKIVSCIKYIRNHQDNPIIVFIDEFEDVIKDDEIDLLTYLDGLDSVENSMFLGCTNFIDQIPERIRNRKSRIKHCIEIKNLSTSLCKEFVSKLLKTESTDIINEFVFKAVDQNLSIDQLKNSIIDYKLENISIDESIKISKKVIE